VFYTLSVIYYCHGRPCFLCLPKCEAATKSLPPSKLTPTFSLFQADQICYAVLCVFSYVAAGIDNQKQRETQLAGIDNFKHQLNINDNQKQQLVIDNNNRDTS
jgi:hypothetical protein